MKQFIKLLVTGVVVLNSIYFIGCGLTDPEDEDTVSITISTIGDITAGDEKQIEGTIEGDPDPDPTGISAKVYDADDAEVASSQISISKQTPSQKSKFDLKDDCSFKIVTTTNACNGTYTLKITATAGSAETTKSATFTVVNGKNCSGTAITTITLEAGANKNSTLGSSIDFDDGDGHVWLASDAANHLAEIDLCYAHTASNGDKVGSATWAEASGYDFAETWSNPPNNKIKELSITSTEFDAVSTVEEIESIWDDAGSEISSLTVVEGDFFIVKTTEGNYALVKIDEQTPGETGSITIKVAK